MTLSFIHFARKRGLKDFTLDGKSSQSNANYVAVKTCAMIFERKKESRLYYYKTFKNSCVFPVFFLITALIDEVCRISQLLKLNFGNCLHVMLVKEYGRDNN